jgi:uncharacterized protein YbjT (DUF2867 family)
MSTANVVVVGGRGFIGGAIADSLRSRGHHVTIVSSNRAAAAKLPNARYGDVLRPETMPAAVEGAEVLIQSANFSTYPFEKPRQGHTFFAFDSLATRNLVQVAKKAGVRRYLFVSGVGASAASPKPYFRAIGDGEKAVVESGLEAVLLRPAFVYGPRDRGINTIIRFARLFPFVPMLANGQQLHQPVFIDDVANAAAQLVDQGAPQGIFEIGGPERMVLREVVERAFRVAGMGSRSIIPVPLPLARFGSSILERLPYALLTRSGIDFAAQPFVADNDKLLNSISLVLTPFEQGLGSYLGTNTGAKPQ